MSNPEYKTRSNLGAEKKAQIRYSDERGADGVSEPVLVQGEVLTGDFTAGAILVGKGSLLRIRVAATAYIAFSSLASLGVVSSSTTPALELFTAGTYLVRAREDYLRSSAALARVEKTEQ